MVTMLKRRDLPRLLTFISCSLLILCQVSFAYPSLEQSACYCFPGESCWPNDSQWAEFNRTVGGRLIATTPIGSVCHLNNPWVAYNASACETLRAYWDFPKTHYQTSSSIMAGFYANQSCDPFLSPSSRCIIGTYVQYAVRAESAADIQKTLAFITAHRIRLIVRNTGHDYLGKSTGAGAVAIWTHHLKEIDFLDYQSPNYTGSAIKVGAGVQIFESNAAASQRGLTVVGGNCRTVGLAGGYTQGGGHGQLVSRFGLAADQVLEWEVVTAAGDLITATPYNDYADLYWALSGGGGGTYGVVVSMTSRAYPEMRTATANLTIAPVSTGQQTAFYEVISAFFNSTLGPLLDARGAGVWLLTSAGFEATPLTIPGGTRAQLQAIVEPVLAALNRTSGVLYTYHIEEFPSFYSSFETMSPDENITEYNLGGRFIPRQLLDREPQTFVDRFRRIAGSGAVISGISVNASHGNTHANSVNPAWRDAAIDVVVGTPLSSTNTTLNIQNQRLITDVLLPQLEEITPRGGAYLNEADPHQPQWQKTFYGANYDRLLQIKKKYDPEDIFYALTAVGSEPWVQKEDGRLCLRPKSS